VLQNRLWLWQCSRLLGTCTFVDVYNVYCISSSGMCQKLWYYLPYLYMNTFHILHIFTLSTTSHLSCCEQTGIPIVPGSWGVATATSSEDKRQVGGAAGSVGEWW
jgi:hypothetical protein